MNDYRRGAAPSVKCDFLPGHNENPRGREGCHVFEVLPDVLGGSFQDDRVHGLSVIDLASNPIVHICPKGAMKALPSVRGKDSGVNWLTSTLKETTPLLLTYKDRRGFAQRIQDCDTFRVINQNRRSPNHMNGNNF